MHPLRAFAVNRVCSHRYSRGEAIRAVSLDGALWFPAVDVAEGIGADRYSIGKNMRMMLDANETRLMLKSETEGEIRRLFTSRSPRILLISESGLYKFILRAHPSNPAAKAFQDWVTQVVLPAIGKDGAYIKDEEKVASGEVPPSGQAFDDLC